MKSNLNQTHYQDVYCYQCCVSKRIDVKTLNCDRSHIRMKEWFFMLDTKVNIKLTIDKLYDFRINNFLFFCDCHFTY